MLSEIKDIYLYRHMIYRLVQKDLRGRYKGSALGFLWTFINPLLQLCVYTVVFGYILKSGLDKFYLYLFVGLVPWIFFSSSLVGGSNVILGEKNLVQKIYFPREVIPIAYVSSCFTNMLFTFIIIIPTVLLSGVKLTFAGILCLIAIMLIQYILVLGFTFISSSATVYARDLEHILNIITMVWMYLTPLFYPIDIVPKEYKWLIELNPLTSVIQVYRDILYYGQLPNLTSLLTALIYSVVIFVLGVWVFRRLKKNFAEEL